MDKEEIIVKAYDNAQEMIKFADSKANLSILIQSLLITIGLGTTLISDSFGTLWSYNQTYFWLYFVFIFIFVGFSMTGIVISICVYKARFSPESKEEKREGVIYHRHIANYKDSLIFKQKIESIKESDIYEDYIIQTFNVALIANKKMNFVNKSIWFLFVNIALTAILMVVSASILIIN